MGLLLQKMSETEKQKKSVSGAQIASIVSTVLWILGFALAFVIPKESKLIWIPDTMLLVGFWPLLYAWRPGWPWVLFGILNVMIGICLWVMAFLPDSAFTEGLSSVRLLLAQQHSPLASLSDTDLAHQLIMVRNHLTQQHSALAWTLIGIISTIFGIIRMVRSLVRWIGNRTAKATD